MGFLKKIFLSRKSSPVVPATEKSDDTGVRRNRDSSPPFTAHFREDVSNKSDVPEEKRAHSVVELQRSNEAESWGVVLRGGAICPRIAHLHPGSLAHRSDMLSPGDVVTSVNGISTRGMRADDVTSLVESAKYKVVLDVEYEIPPARAPRPAFVIYRMLNPKPAVENSSPVPAETLSDPGPIEVA